MNVSKSSEITARYAMINDQSAVKGAGGLACVVFTAVLGCAFWAGAVLASTPLVH